METQTHIKNFRTKDQARYRALRLSKQNRSRKRKRQYARELYDLKLKYEDR